MREAVDGTQLLDDIAVFALSCAPTFGEDEALWISWSGWAMGSEEDGEDCLCSIWAGGALNCHGRRRRLQRLQSAFRRRKLTSSFLLPKGSGDLSKSKEFVYELLDKQSGYCPEKRKIYRIGVQ